MSLINCSVAGAIQPAGINCIFLKEIKFTQSVLSDDRDIKRLERDFLHCPLSLSLYLVDVVLYFMELLTHLCF